MGFRRILKHAFLLTEIWNCAVIDSGASKTVCGNQWLDVFLDSISDFDKNKIVFSESNSYFKFGIGSSIKALYSVSLPVIKCRCCRRGYSIITLKGFLKKG